MKVSDEAAVMSGGRSVAVAAYEAAQDRRARWIIVLRIVVGIALLAVWELSSGRLVDKLFISSPSAVSGRLWQWLWNGTLWNNLSITNILTAILLIGLVGMLLDLGFARLQRLVTYRD